MGDIHVNQIEFPLKVATNLSSIHQFKNVNIFASQQLTDIL